MGKGLLGPVRVLSLVLLGLTGCGSNRPDPEYVKQLRTFAAAYHGYHESTRMAPGSLDDLKNDWGSFPIVRHDIESGQLVVTWGASLERSAAENDNFLLAYEVDAPQKGGLVLLGGGTVRQVTAEEFARLGQFKPQGKRVG
ncbi:MAG TPA: hypothetical protein VKE94_11980 [Gemmataceae bacterium]|nr:hypothetical protein [Gemmataceae bacterium]